MHEQLERFRAVAEPAKERHPEITLHAANSAATLRDPATHFDMVRCGVAIYGLDPFGRDPRDHGLEPALELRSYVADVKRFEPGASAGYGRTWTGGRGDLGRAGADRLRRRLAPRPLEPGQRAGRRREAARSSAPSRWTTSPSTSGPRPSVSAFDEVVLIGERAGGRILAEDLARELGTINYEVTTGLLPRVEREYEGGAVSRVGDALRRGARGRGSASMPVDGRLGRRRRGARRPAGPRRRSTSTSPSSRARGERGARAIAKAAGAAAFQLSEEFGTWRVEARDHSWHLDVTRLRADDIEGDLAPSRLHGERDRGSAWPTPTPSRSIPPAASPTSRRGSCARRRIERSQTIHCGSSAPRGSPARSDSRSSPDTLELARAEAAAPRSRRGSGASPSCAS